jgi:hypothetical protein
MRVEGREHLHIGDCSEYASLRNERLGGRRRDEGMRWGGGGKDGEAERTRVWMEDGTARAGRDRVAVFQGRDAMP